MRRNEGFTLIELLVVIGIISLLAAILFPVFASAREKARATACLSNLKQIGLAYSQYEQDYDETCVVGDAAFGTGRGWAGELYPYAKSAGLFICPNDSNAGDFISYATNANMVGYVSGTPAKPLPAQVSMFAAPASTVMLFEVRNCSATGASWSFCGVTGTTGAVADYACSPAGYGTQDFSMNSLYGANGTSGSTSTTALKYNTGLLYGAAAVDGSCANNVCDSNPLDITGANSYFTGADGVHVGGANYLMADCHAKWLRPTLVGPGYDYFNGTAWRNANCTSGAWHNNGDAYATSCLSTVGLTATFALK